MRDNVETVISVDLGTSSVRACLVNAALEICYQAQQQVSLNTDPLGKAVQNADTIINAGLQCLMVVLDWAGGAGYQPKAFCFSSAVASLVCLDRDFTPLAPALTYIDLRADRQSVWLAEQFGPAYFQQTATPIHASYWLPKLLWLKGQGEDLSQGHYFCTIKDLFVYRLTGQFVTDYSNAVATGMCDVTTGDWDQRSLKIAGLRKDQLPQIRPTTTLLSPVDSDFFPADRRPQGLKIVLGAMDGVLSSLGAGAFKPGQVTTMIGSSGACRIASHAPIIDTENFATWSYPLDEEIWMSGGAMNNGGLVTQWLVENFSEQRNTRSSSYDEMFALAATIAPGADGLIFLPYLLGERAPIYDENARGVYFGLHADHHRGHFIRAGLEGVLLAMYSIFDMVRPSTGEIEIRATGGYLRSPLMLQIQADIFGLPIHIPANLEGSSIGAAALAMKATGMIQSFDEIARFIPVAQIYAPDPERSQIYREVYPRFRALYAHLKPLFVGPEGAF